MTKRFMETSLRLLLVALAMTLTLSLEVAIAAEEGLVLYLSFDEPATRPMPRIIRRMSQCTEH